MADLSCSFLGIESPNPFWLASAPPTDKALNVYRAFEAGWGGAVWKTLGEDPPPVNVCSRYSAHKSSSGEVIGINNVELITDRPLSVNLSEIRQTKKDWPDRALIVSLMVPCEKKSWQDILKQVEDTGCDGVELNFGCPHGMPERGMGAAVGQVPEYIEMVTQWCKESTDLPVIVKLTPNITNITLSASAAKRAGADAVSLINTINSITGIDLDSMTALGAVGDKYTSGGYCGSAVKPIALNMVGQIGRHPETAGIPVSGIGGISNWHDAAEFIALGAGNVQVCTAAMLNGFKVISDLTDGLSQWMDSKGYKALNDFRGRALAGLTDWKYLDLNYKTVAHINQELCIQCGRCFAACEDTEHQAISVKPLSGEGWERRFEVQKEQCVGCNLCQITCPVNNCISMVRGNEGSEYLPWVRHPANPLTEKP
ncbi:NAD-dependent dihydropyrimidine dehydrogenase subunit PreA [Endozoicomonas sp. OPT23]|uniref:NAD-dependent dihydropyrimidine dehydrogenase subunit PreA n=1 Tax=Endozoicomonas sp. OPT23 TaxID=2072845 RepID=UPI00129A45F6|nr:NAD-dependent dihydropyrimidine dehydrogenase subunit PreA [Endozoicomonas sp. OPT23]MRI31406.1 NAD-dependent dihydropyrimidine dehydrogenase subunit PreA [Endozoicomonas sp. OPT23]